MERAVPSPSDIPIRGLVERRKLPQRGPGRSPCRKWILYFRSEKKPSGTPFSVFLSDGVPPPNVAGPGKTSPFSLIDGPEDTTRKF